MQERLPEKGGGMEGERTETEGPAWSSSVRSMREEEAVKGWERAPVHFPPPSSASDQHPEQGTVPWCGSSRRCCLPAAATAFSFSGAIARSRRQVLHHGDSRFWSLVVAGIPQAAPRRAAHHLHPHPLQMVAAGG